jgi:preprotein translocase subunit SecA
MTAQIQKKPYTEQQRIAYFALVCEAASRTLGMNPFDIQVLGGLALCDGKLIEMQTGEGKTLVAVLPACLQALSQQGVHILTFNDYLAKRDAEWMRPIYEWMGLTVAFVTESQSLSERQQAYCADITYATAKQAGFDHLRDHLCYHPQNLLHRTPHWAIVDEADSILIDEARVPLVIAGETTAPISDPAHLSKLIHSLDPQTDTETDEHKHNVYLTDKGLDKLEKALDCGDLHTPQNLALLTDINCALYAHILLQRNIDYIVRQQKIEVVDEFTGRVAKDRRWPDGLQAALDAKEGLPIQPRGSTLGSITLQHFVKTYTHLSGMTATAQTASEEFKSCYDLDIVVIPPNRPCIREDHPDILFTHKAAKQKALIEEITQTHQTGRPTLVGTSNVEESDTLAQTLQDQNITCHVLNAKNDEEEAAIIANAGAWEAITISTNMAGRGTDIQLGGTDGHMRDEIIALGGLYVIGTNRHESLRIDNQLRGRAGRQGDPGASRFIICLKDHLIQRYGIDALIPKKHRPHKQDAPIDHPVVHREIARAQRIVEGQSADIRKTLWTYADIVEQHRQDIHQLRQDILNDKESPPTFAEHAPVKLASIALSPEQIYQYEKHLTLSVIDKCWREYLTDIGHIREGIHLVSLGGQNPLDEFRKTIHQAFQTLNEKIEHEIQHTYNSAILTENGLQLDNTRQVPSTTWTYLVHDNNTMGKTIERLLVGNSNVGQAAVGALLLGPILFIMGVYRRIFRKSSR